MVFNEMPDINVPQTWWNDMLPGVWTHYTLLGVGGGFFLIHRCLLLSTRVINPFSQLYDCIFP